MTGILTTSRAPERCDACGNAIPAGNVYVLEWQWGATPEKQYWHLDCHPGDMRVMRMIEGVRDWG